MFDSLKRLEIDGRNSVDREDTIWEEIADDCNDPTYAPVSITFAKLHTMFRIAMDLSLWDDWDEEKDAITPEAARKIIKDLFARFKKAFNHWKASGNGKAAKAAEGGEEIRLLINGTDYAEDEKEAA